MILNINKLALTLPGLDPSGKTGIEDIENFKYLGGHTDLARVLTDLFDVVFFLAFFLAFFWLVWGAFQYMVAGGNKENLAKARLRIIWAIIGLVLVLLAFLVAQFAEQIIKPQLGRGTPLI